MNNTNIIDLNNVDETIKKKSILPTNDVVFHCLFGTKGNERITKKFIEEIINKQVEDIDLDLNLNLAREHYDDKLGILDVRVKDKNGVNYNIEMQNATSITLPERILSYWSRLFNGDLKVGQSYNKLNKTIAIIILNDNMKILERIKDKFHTKWKIREETYKEIIFTDYFELHIIELKKYEELKTKENENIWLDFILRPEGKEVLKAMTKNKELKEANEEWKKIIADKKKRDRALRLEIARLDYNTGMENARDEGVESEKVATAKRLLQKKVEIDFIVDITGLAKEIIEEIARNS